jgi:hypothetical protein
MLPARRAGIMEMWNALTIDTSTAKEKKTVYENRGFSGRRFNGHLSGRR